MDSAIMACFGEIQSTDHVAFDCFEFVVFAPVDIWPPGLAGAVHDMSRLDLVELVAYFCLMLHADCGSVDILAGFAEEVVEMACDPAACTPDQEACRSSEMFHYYQPKWPIF